MEPTQTPRLLSGRYELAHLVARGGMAEVYRAHDRLLDRPVALKVLFPELSVDRSFVERFRREAQAAANLFNPNIVPVFDWGEDDGTYFIVMEFVDGRPLSSILRTAGPLHPDRVAEIAADVAAALAYAHRHGVIHRDVKPGNVLITDEGTVKVTDFGIARAVNTEESLTQTGAVMGTATYFSPEQAEGVGVDSRSDIYSLGVVMFEMVTGRPPFVGDTPVAVASKHVRDHPPAPHDINPSVPPDLEAIIMKCMAKSPEYRYPTGDDLRVDLMRFREGRAVGASMTAVMAGVGGTTAVVGAVDPTRTQTVPMVPGGEEEEPPRSRMGPYVAVLVLMLAALGVLVAVLGQSLGWWHFGSSSASFALPNVAGKSLAQAEQTLHADGLDTTVAVDPTSNALTTRVLRTSPAAGTSVHRGQTIIIFTGSRAPTPAVKRVSIQQYIGQSVGAAQSELRAIGLTPFVQVVPRCIELNVVCDQSPEYPASLTAGSVVTLFTAAQPTTTTTTVPPTTTTTVPPTTTTTRPTTTTTSSSTTTTSTTTPHP